MTLKKILSNTVSSALLLAAAAIVVSACPRSGRAAGITAYETAFCADLSTQAGADVTACADTSLPDCSPPPWFPANQLPDTYTTEPTSATQRFNETEYGPGNYTHFEHDWYSSSTVPMGPALARIGHVWNRYAGSSLIQSVSCDQYGTWSYP